MSEAPEADGAPLFLVDEVPAGNVLTVDGAEGRHAVDVLRLGVGERVRVSDGQGLVVIGSVLAAADSAMQVQVLTRHDVPAPDPTFVLVQALPKGDHGPLAVDLATELGVDRVVPWTAARCVTRWRDDRVDKGLAKWRSAARAASKQARRPRVPEVTEPMSTRQVCGMLADVDLALVLHEQARQPFTKVDVPKSGTIAVIVGPEGGLTDGEVVAFRAAGAHSVRLGAEVLRTSTAGAAALAALSARTRWA
ncbi:16S rRNA (uracil(1498)-N(3))-methyltransferase [Modestobacter versicolor]|uniref:Ribosomal RNA small subunit methyltransferase E n=1 Tax=Modestobacter versicolor TaxID=429133 RepID=A0A323VF51_9ACTN|nr:16S rRNA (uracil(1498)-N(3))-methyltransferase [Modestobacter versicolor]MBB3675881.1 16S rRNA (uracil1498-N3)-methyltransferase [Modestobacter versicolor]PZA22800.1 16S rRNA (uracil(1498)-N(3))-methyltransferase [Modestobacter versicolor]